GLWDPAGRTQLPDSLSMARDAVDTATPRRMPADKGSRLDPASPSHHRGARGRSCWRSELVLGREADLATLNRPGKEHIAEASRRTELACIAFREADLVGQVRPLHAELPVLPEVRDDAGAEHVIAAERLPAHNVLVALAGVLV